MKDTIKEGVEDLYLEHSQHRDKFEEKCSECDRESRELTEDKRREEAEQAERDEVEGLSNNEEE